MSESKDEKIEVCHETLFGPTGHPELSLIVTVNNIGQQVKMLMKFGWSMAILGSGLVIKEIWTLMTHAG
jgi:hypothetical protein